jgi:hypothetical protein
MLLGIIARAAVLPRGLVSPDRDVIGACCNCRLGLGDVWHLASMIGSSMTLLSGLQSWHRRCCGGGNARTVRVRAVSVAVAAVLLALAGTAGVHAEAVHFTEEWSEQRFSLFSSNDFDPQDRRLDVKSNGTVSIFWTRLTPARWQTRKASWHWQVRQGVPATDLTLKGGDDRNLALYFVFLPRQAAEKAKDAGLSDLLDASGARVLMYVWGGRHAVGSILPTPYLGERGRTIVRHAAGNGEADTAVDLAKDYLAAFGEPVQTLVGLAVSADSDDTATKIDASISNLMLLP